MKNEFKSFLLTEEKMYLGTKVGDILTSLEEMNKDASNIGKRHLMRLIKNIVKQIRRIIHGSWTFEEERYLKTLQKVGVALMKGLDDSSDLPELIASATDEIQKLSDNMGEPINNLAAPAINKSNPES